MWVWHVGVVLGLHVTLVLVHLRVTFFRFLNSFLELSLFECAYVQGSDDSEEEDNSAAELLKSLNGRCTKLVCKISALYEINIDAQDQITLILISTLYIMTFRYQDIGHMSSVITYT